MNHRGATLLEIIPAIGILAVIVLFVGTLYPAGVLSMDKSQRRLEANLLAQSLLEDYRSRAFEELKVGSAVRLQPVQGTGLFEPTVTIHPAAGLPPSQLVEIRVHVLWKDRNGPQSQEVSVYVSQVAH